VTDIATGKATADDTATSLAIERTVELRAAPERVWQAITDPTEISAWLGQRADFTAEPGADGWFAWDHVPGRYAVRVEEVDAPRRLTYRWMNEPDAPLDERATLVAWTLTPTPSGGTLLHLREEGFGAADGRRANAVGWFEELGHLIPYLAEEPWEAGISRTWAFRAGPERVWDAISDLDRLRAWGPIVGLDPFVAGATGWLHFPGAGPRALRVEDVDPPTYLAWRWATEVGVALEGSRQPLRVEWVAVEREDGGADLHLRETGFIGPDDVAHSARGWDDEVLPLLRRALGEGDA